MLGDEIIERLLYQKGGLHCKRPEDIPFIAKQTRIVLKNCGKYDAESLEEYIASGGFRALEKAMFEMNPDQVIARGAGGADRLGHLPLVQAGPAHPVRPGVRRRLL